MNYTSLTKQQLNHEYKKRMRALLPEDVFNLMRHQSFSMAHMRKVLIRDGRIIREHAERWRGTR